MPNNPANQETKVAVKNTINWFEIPVTNVDRATKFYSTILGIQMQRMEAGGVNMAMFPGMPNGGVHGALVQGEAFIPSDKGSIVYLNAGNDLTVVQGKIEAAGGKILKAKFGIGEHGFIAYFKDTEGNKVALHSMR